MDVLGFEHENNKEIVIHNFTKQPVSFLQTVVLTLDGDFER